MAFSTGIVCAALALLPSTGSGNIQEQRARLPPPATCQDPVEGVWMSHEYKPRYNDWYIFTLTVRRMPHNPTQLTGDITARSWCCGREKQQPPLCPPGQFHWVVFMTGAGTANGQQIRFGGTSWRVQEVVCGYGPGGYNLDQFSGTIDPALQEFQSINNDGGRSVNEPTVFRRIRCLDQAQQQHVPHVKVAPPPLRPPRGGCGL